MARDARQVMLELEEEERRLSGIQSLKIKYNRVFGYYLEVTKPNLHLVPADWDRFRVRPPVSTKKVPRQ